MAELIHYSNGVLSGHLDVRVYRLSAIKKVGYRLAHRGTLSLGALDGALVPITFRPVTPIGEAEAEELARAFMQELLDQDLREHVADETAALRTLILAHAFSKTGLAGEP